MYSALADACKYSIGEMEEIYKQNGGMQRKDDRYGIHSKSAVLLRTWTDLFGVSPQESKVE